MELSKKEKEAIEIVNDLTEMIEEELQYENETYRRADEEDWQSLKIVLNLISKLQKENKKQGKVIDEMAKAWKQDDIRSAEEIKQYFYGKVERRWEK